MQNCSEILNICHDFVKIKEKWFSKVLKKFHFDNAYKSSQHDFPQYFKIL